MRPLNKIEKRSVSPQRLILIIGPVSLFPLRHTTPPNPNQRRSGRAGAPGLRRTKWAPSHVQGTRDGRRRARRLWVAGMPEVVTKETTRRTGSMAVCKGVTPEDEGPGVGGRDGGKKVWGEDHSRGGGRGGFCGPWGRRRD